MAIQPGRINQQSKSGFGKRGRVSLQPEPHPQPPSAAEGSTGIGALGWIGGAVAAIALFAFMATGVGSGGLFGGLLGGLLANKMMNSAKRSTTGVTPVRAAEANNSVRPSSRSVRRGGFGTRSRSIFRSAGG